MAQPMRPATEAPSTTRGVRRGDAALAIGVIASVVAVQVYFALGPTIPGSLGTAASFSGPLAALLVVVGWTRYRGERLSDHGWYLPARWPAALAVVTFLVAIYALVLLEPGAVFGYSSVEPPGPLDLLYWVAYAPLAALGSEALFRGLLLERLLAPHRLPLALGVSAGAFAVTATNVPALVGLAVPALGRTLLLTTVTAFALGVVLGFYYYRSGRSLLGPVGLRTGVLYTTVLLPVVSNLPGWQFAFLLTLLGAGALMFLVTTLQEEPRVVAHTYLEEPYRTRTNRFLLRARRRREALRAVAAVGASVVALGIVYLASQAVLGARQPVLAIESGSMAPALHVGDLVLVERVAPAAISVGTVIAFSSACLPSPVVHRVVGIAPGPEGPTYTTRGDANSAADPCTTPYGSVIGRVTTALPVLGYAVLFPQVAVGVLALGVVLAFAFSSTPNPRFPPRRHLV